MGIDPRARAYVAKGIERGMTYSEMADLCGVSEGSVKRWVTTGRANARVIEPLVRHVGAVRLTPKDLGDTLIEIYKRRKKRFSMTWVQLRRLYGQTIRTRLIEELREYLDNRGYFFGEVWQEIDRQSVFLMISHRQLRRHVKEALVDEDIQTFFVEDETEEDEETEVKKTSKKKK
jgi:hypothetical protein